MVQAPNIIIDGRRIDSQVRRAGRTFIVEFHLGVQWKLILHHERKIAGARIRPGTDDRINLAVLTGIGPVQFCIEDGSVQNHASMQAGQRAHDVVGTEITVALDQDVGQTTFGDLNLHGRIGQLLLRQSHGNRHIAAFRIGSL